MNSVSRYTNKDLFSPLDGDIGVSTKLTFGSNEKDLNDGYMDSEPPPLQDSRRFSIPRKPVPNYGKIENLNESSLTMVIDENLEVEKTEKVKVKRGWRFYGTFACLAILNLICAIDATILAVALPVGIPVERLEFC
jgi:hypothetical protein